MTLCAVALVGGLGAVARFVIDALIARHNPFRLPLGTLVLNVTGALLLGLLAGWATTGADGSATTKLLLGTGFCGGYTTFSSASVETLRLWRAQGPSSATVYAGLTLAGSLAAAVVGMSVGSLL